MKIVLWNVLRDASVNDIFTGIERIEREHNGIDLLCLCEVTDELLELLKTNGFKTFFQPRGDTSGGLLVAARASLPTIKAIQLSKKRYRYGLHTSEVLLANISAAEPFTLAFTHLTYNRPSRWIQRAREQKMLLSALPRTNCVLIGDLNTYPIELPIPSIISKLKRIGFMPLVKGPTWHSLAKRPIGFAHMQLDHVLGTKDVQRKMNAQILDFHLPSDHSPIVVTVVAS